MRQTYRARVQKTHGKKGEVVAVPADGLPVLLKPDMTVWVVPPRLKGPRSMRVAAADEGRVGQLVRLEGVGDLDGASKLVGRSLLVSTDELPEDFGLHDPQGLLGREVVDEGQGFLGRIVEVMQGVANDGWQVEGPRGTILVPVVPEYVRGIDEDGTVVVDLPEGMVPEGEDA